MDRLLRHALLASTAVHVAAAAALHAPEREVIAPPVIEARLLLPAPAAEPVAMKRPEPVPQPAPTSRRPDAPRTAVMAMAAPAAASVPALVPSTVETPPAAPVVVAAAAPVAVAVLEPPRYDAAYLANPAPPYPASARRRGVEGTVTVEARVGPGGEAREVRLAATAGDAALDGAALEAVRGWRFVPARRGDQAEEAWVRIPLVFRLN